MPSLRKGDVWLGFALLAISVIVLVLSRSIEAIGLGDNSDPGPTAFPIGLSAILAIGGLIEIWQSRIQSSPSPQTSTIAPRPASRAARPVLFLLACFLLYVILLPWLGFALSTLVMATGMMVLLGNSWKLSSLVSLILITLIYFLFVVLFKVPLPGGVFGLPF